MNLQTSVVIYILAATVEGATAKEQISDMY